jgi:hypothetical protein
VKLFKRYNFNEVQTALAFVAYIRHEQNQFTKSPILHAKQFQKISTEARQFKVFQALLYKLKDFKAFNFVSKFKDSQ